MLIFRTVRHKKWLIYIFKQFTTHHRFWHYKNTSILAFICLTNIRTIVTLGISLQYVCEVNMWLSKLHGVLNWNKSHIVFFKLKDMPLQRSDKEWFRSSNRIDNTKVTLPIKNLLNISLLHKILVTLGSYIMQPMSLQVAQSYYMYMLTKAEILLMSQHILINEWQCHKSLTKFLHEKK